MRNILLKFAHWIWKTFSFERFPPFYYNNRKYKIMSIKYSDSPDDPEKYKIIIITAKEDK
jgi:hypothetical protein